MHLNQCVRAQQQRGVHRRVVNSDSYEFFNLLTGPELLGQVETLLPEHRERLFPPTETLSMFLAPYPNRSPPTDSAEEPKIQMSQTFGRAVIGFRRSATSGAMS